MRKKTPKTEERIAKSFIDSLMGTEMWVTIHKAGKGSYKLYYDYPQEIMLDWKGEQRLKNRHKFYDEINLSTWMSHWQNIPTVPIKVGNPFPFAPNEIVEKIYPYGNAVRIKTKAV